MIKLNCGVIGLGRLGMKHALAIAGRISNARLAAVSDPVCDSRKRLTDQFPDIKTFEDYHDLLDIKEIDAVIIASPTTTHTGILLDSIKAGKAVFCEKPLTLDSNEIPLIESACREKAALVQVGFMRRFDSGYMEAKKRIESGEAGDPVSVRSTSRDPSCPPLEFAKKSGGLISDLCIHDIDLVRWFLGSEVSQVFAQGAVLMYPELGAISDIDHADLLLRCQNGTLGCIEGSRNSHYGYDVRTEVVCTKGAVFIGTLHNTPCVVLNQYGENRNTVPGFLDRFEQAYVREIESFTDTVLSGGQPSVSVKDGLAAVRVAVAAGKSLQVSAPVNII
jgi:scyllo-inositol 2-dehydrogenase (NAD+)